MKKAVFCLMLALLCCIFATGAFAEGQVTGIDGQWIVNEQGQCAVSVTVSLTMTQGDANAVFPIPAEATDISLNAQKISPAASGEIKEVSLQSVTGGNPGDFTFSLSYTLPGVVHTGEEGMMLELELLSGFACPVEDMTFTVVLPGTLSAEPVFVSSYYQEQISQQMALNTEAETINGSIDQLKDHESLTMTLAVTETMFPQPAVTAKVMDVLDIAVLACVALALIYFAFTMLPRFIHPGIRTTAPDGVSAGDIQMWLTGSGIDLSLLVVTWAQLGYLRIQVDDSGRVLLHKRMEMGNERSSFEVRTFRNLFGQRRIVDGTGFHYARLCRDLWKKTPGIRDIYRPHSGNPRIFRVLCAVAGMLSGVGVAAGFLPHSLTLKIILAVVGLIFSLIIQSGGASVPRRYKAVMPFALGASLIWILAGALSGELVHSLFIVVVQFICGIASVYGGKRTPLGHQTMEQIYAFRRHLRGASAEELERLMRGNEGYFYQMAPYALALDMDKTFARRCSGMKLGECSYLIVGNQRQMSAIEWSNTLRLAVTTLDHKAHRLPLERLTGH